jgi:hypothetical protein
MVFLMKEKFRKEDAASQPSQNKQHITSRYLALSVDDDKNKDQHSIHESDGDILYASVAF